VEVLDVVKTPTKIPTDDSTAAAAAGVYKFPKYVRDVLTERITKLQASEWEFSRNGLELHDRLGAALGLYARRG